MKRLLVMVAAVTALAAGAASSAGAYGGGASHDTWQVGLSFNCDNPSFCGNDLGGFWGWVEFDRGTDGTITGDAQTTGCAHSVGGVARKRGCRARGHRCHERAHRRFAAWRSELPDGTCST